MKQREQVKIFRAIHSENEHKRNRAVDWLDRKGNIEGLLAVMDMSKYLPTQLRAEAALSKYSYK